MSGDEIQIGGEVLHENLNCNLNTEYEQDSSEYEENSAEKEKIMEIITTQVYYWIILFKSEAVGLYGKLKSGSFSVVVTIFLFEVILLN